MSPENIKQAFKEGKYSSVGSYPLFWVYKDECFCVECAKEKQEEFLEDSENVHCEPNWENDSLYCGECGDRIESAYNEPDVIPPPLPSRIQITAEVERLVCKNSLVVT